MKRITIEGWRHIPSGAEVATGYPYNMKAPERPFGKYTLYEIADDKNCHVEWEWKLETETEDKARITKALLDLLRLTRAGSDIASCDFFTDPVGDKSADEYVRISMDDGYEKLVCVTADSGLALIRDVIRAIE